MHRVRALESALSAGGLRQARNVMGRPSLEDIVLPNKEAHKATLVFMHGLGDTGMGWKEPMKALQGAFPGLKVVLPTAPDLPVSLNGGMMMPAWYDIVGLGARSNERCNGIEESAERLSNLVRQDIALPEQSGRVLLCGFSQGGAMALYTGLQMEHEAGKGIVGVAGLSSYLPCPSSFAEKAKMRRDIPLLMCHGDADEVVKPEWAEESKGVLEKCGYQVDYNTYPGMGHELGQEEFQRFAMWVQSTLQL